MDKKTLFQKINQPNFKYDKAQMNKWVRALPVSAKLKPSKIKKGDVFMHPIFQHPYNIFRKEIRLLGLYIDDI